MLGGQGAATLLPKPEGAPPANAPPQGLPGPQDEHGVLLPLIEAAAKDLASREVLTPDRYESLSRAARRRAFTAARVNSLDTLGRLRDALAESAKEGHTFEEFRENVDGKLGGSPLAPAKLEATFRTEMSAAYNAGQEHVADHPDVTDEFPFIETVPIQDSRLTDLCAVVSRSGLDGTGVFLRDDPEWERLKPPRHFQCRCGTILMSVRDAAGKGVKYAKEWQALGRRPDAPGHVRRAPVELPAGFERDDYGL